MKKIICVLFFCAFYIFTNISVYGEPIEVENKENQYRTIEEVKEELKEERKIQDKQRLEEIKNKKIEKEQKEKDNNNLQENKNKTEEVPKENNKKENDDKNNIPQLIVRLRGTHTTKYLCYYDFVIRDNNSEKTLTKEIIDDYSKLLKKKSLKVRPGENINFEFSEEPSAIKVFIWGDEIEYLNVNRGCIKVPDFDKKIIIGIDGKYKNGSIRYAIVLDIRK